LRGWVFVAVETAPHKAKSKVKFRTLESEGCGTHAPGHCVLPRLIARPCGGDAEVKTRTL
jgi:hypothetical protein